MLLFRHAGPEEPAPYLIRGHPESSENTGFRLEFIPMKIGAGMTTFLESVSYMINRLYLMSNFKAQISK
jgi:hypothetical protein